MKTTLRRPVPSIGVATVIALGLAAPALNLVSGPASAATLQVPTVTAEERCPAPSSTLSAAQNATVSASHTASWNNINSVRDGAVLHTGGQQNQIWGTYSTNRPAQQWLQYDWSGTGSLTGAAVSFWHDNASDTAGDGVAVPKAWKLQSWDGAAWKDIALKDGAGYPRAKDAVNSVTFAAPVSTSKLRAVFDAATNGTTYAAVAVSEFSVEGDVPPNPKLGEEVLASDSFNVAVSRNTGGVYQLGNAADGPECTNYVMNPTQRPAFDVNDSRWVGDLGMKVNGSPRMTGLSDDIRKVSSSAEGIQVAYSGTSANAAGIRGFNLTEKYALTGENRDVLDWSIDIENTTAQSMEIQDLSIPLLMNSWWTEHDQTAIYEKNVARHSYVADDGSYMYWQRPNGQGPYLVMVPDENTQLEFKDKARPGEGPFAEKDPNFEGLVEYYVHSKSAAPTRVNAGKAAQYLPATSATVAAGQKTSYGFTFRWAKDYADLHNVLYEAGVVDTVSLPGMTIPQDTTAKLAVRAKNGIDSVVPGGGTGSAGANATITPAGEANGYKLYDVKFNSLGENFVTVNYAGGKKSVLQYYSIEPVEKLIEANASFIAKNQQAKDPARGYDGAYMQWDMRSKQKVTRQNVATTALGTIDEFRLRWMTGGSDDAGLSPAAFLAEKNAQSPNKEQIASLDYYIDNFLLGYLQNQWKDGKRTWNVYHWYDGGDGDRPATGSDSGNGGVGDGLATWRVMNSPHVWNTYFAMYKIAKAHPELAERSAADYLDFAYNTMKAYFEHKDAGKYLPNASREMASMGELSLPLVKDALVSEGRTAEADVLQQFFRKKYDVFASKKYPFASEMSIDTTAFESNYTLAKMFGNDELSRKVTAASLAARGTQPLWYYYGGDNRHMGESWWNLGYETHLGAWQQQEYLKSYDTAANGFDFDETMRSTYGAYLAGWANINSGQISADPANYGAASWQYQSEKGTSEYGFIPNFNGWWTWSGESALGFWGGLKTAAVDVVDDKVVGTYAYGGDVKLVDGSYQITPKDGVRQRLNMFNKGKFGFELDAAKYTAAKVASDLSSIEISLENVTDAAFSPTVSLSNLPEGTYQVSVDGTKTQTVTSDGKSATVALKDLNKDAKTLKIAKDQPVEPKVAASVAGSEPNDNGWRSGPVTVTLALNEGAKAGIEYRLGDGAWQPYQEAIDLAQDGETTISYRAVTNGSPVENSGGVETVRLDQTAPVVKVIGGPATNFTFGHDPEKPTCEAHDATSGLASCVITGGGTTAGDHSYVATATDNAGNVSTAELKYKVLPWDMKGFTAPVDMSGVWNTVKGGSTVPLKFEIFDGATEITDPAQVKGFSTATVACPAPGAATDPIEVADMGTTSLTYEDGQFKQKWQTPKKSGACVQVTMTAKDDSTIKANFILK